MIDLVIQRHETQRVFVGDEDLATLVGRFRDHELNQQMSGPELRVWLAPGDDADAYAAEIAGTEVN